jgi:single-stranded DNA-specific DHH superfamily exonuclease
MNIEYLIGSKKEFFEFVDLITSADKIAIISHTDLDGLASALFMEKILEAENLKPEELYFLGINKDMVSEILLKLKEKEITKVFILDIGVDSIDPEGFSELRREIDVFLIDHHPSNEVLEDKRNVIKTASSDCTAMTVFDLGKDLIDIENWEWLNCAAIFSDYSHKKKENFEYIKSVYPEVRLENISTSVPGVNARKISSTLIYYKNDAKHVYDLVKERKMDELTEIYQLIEEEVNRIVEDFSKNKEYYPEKNLYFYEVVSNFKIMSYVVSMISKMGSNKIFVFMFREGDYIKFSARNQGGEFDVSALMKKCVEGLEGANGGGHRAASAAKIKSEDLEEFKKRLLL